MCKIYYLPIMRINGIQIALYNFMSLKYAGFFTRLNNGLKFRPIPHMVGTVCHIWNYRNWRERHMIITQCPHTSIAHLPKLRFRQQATLSLATGWWWIYRFLWIWSVFHHSEMACRLHIDEKIHRYESNAFWWIGQDPSLIETRHFCEM